MTQHPERLRRKKQGPADLDAKAIETTRVAMPAADGRSNSMQNAGPVQRLGALPAGSLRAGPVQAKLEVGASDDPLEQEADAKADQIMRAADGSSGSAAPGGAAPASVHTTLQSAGQSPDAATRAFAQSHFGRDIGDVRVHTDSTAAQSAQEIHARAYTSGRDIVFGPGQYAPHTQAGQRLLAHELTHVAQQADGRTGAVQRDVINMPAETITSTRNPVDRAVPGLGNLQGQGVTSGGPTLAHSQQSITQNAPTPTDLLPFRGGGWDGDTILTRLGQYDTVAGTDSDAIRCVQAVAMASRITRGPAAVANFLRSMILEGMISRTMGQRERTAKDVLEYVIARIEDQTGDLRRSELGAGGAARPVLQRCQRHADGRHHQPDGSQPGSGDQPAAHGCLVQQSSRGHRAGQHAAIGRATAGQHLAGGLQCRL